MNQRIAALAILALASLWGWGCTTASPHTPFSYSGLRSFAEIPEDLQPVEGAHWKPGKTASKLHAWHAIDTYPLPEFGTYTYVLQPVLDPCNAESRLEMLLDALISTIPQARDSRSMVAPASTNIFLLPVTALEGADFSVNGRHIDFNKPHDMCLSYIQETAYAIMVAIQKNIGALAASPRADALKFPNSARGPILISSNVPYEKLVVGSELLWIDLSRTPSDAYAQILEEYRRRISDSPITNVAEFRSFAVSFVSFISRFFEATQAGTAVYERGKRLFSPDQ